VEFNPVNLFKPYGVPGSRSADVGGQDFGLMSGVSWYDYNFLPPRSASASAELGNGLLHHLHNHML